MAQNHQLSASTWFRYGDTCSKRFFDFHRIGRKRTLLKELTTEGGEVTGQEDLAHYSRSFYTKLYTSEAHTPGTEEAREECWASTPTRVSSETNRDLIKDLTLKEVQDAILAMPKGKAPGWDGIPTEFYQEFVSEISPTLFQAFQAMLRNGETSEGINKGLITLIPKSGDHANLGNWRPITLLGSLYKILAKTLARRLQGFLPNIIRPGQTGFVEGRSILDNIFLAQEAHDWAEESNQNLVLLLLDFEKAFDRIEWGFLFEALSRLGFCPQWIRWVSSLYSSATSAIKLNGVVGDTFPLARSVRQGCPLSPYLFILATDILGHMLDDPRFGVEGLALPRGGKVTDQTFADDTALYLQGTRENMERTQRVLDVFCKASGAKINWDKSSAIWASNKEREWEWGRKVDLQWISKGKGVRYLGIQVGYHLLPEANFDKMLSALKGKLISWSTCRLWLAGRILVANQVLLASMWYLAASWDPNPRMCSRVRGVVRNFIWSGKSTNARAKVKWETLVLPTTQGGLRIIDPKTQSEALLAKLLVRGRALEGARAAQNEPNQAPGPWTGPKRPGHSLDVCGIKT